MEKHEYALFPLTYKYFICIISFIGFICLISFLVIQMFQICIYPNMYIINIVRFCNLYLYYVILKADNKEIFVKYYRIHAYHLKMHWLFTIYWRLYWLILRRSAYISLNIGNMQGRHMEIKQWNIGEIYSTSIPKFNRPTITFIAYDSITNKNKNQI